MEKKKRSKCLTSHRKVFTVNEANPKEKVIYDFLALQYNEAEVIKDILCDYIITNNLQSTQHSVNMVQALGKHSVINNAVMCKTSVNSSADNCEESVSNSMITYNNEEEINKNGFNIDLNTIKDEEIKVVNSQGDEVKKANSNALNFLKNGI